jgi:hypothetical protein
METHEVIETVRSSLSGGDYVGGKGVGYDLSYEDGDLVLTVCVFAGADSEFRRWVLTPKPAPELPNWWDRNTVWTIAEGGLFDAARRPAPKRAPVVLPARCRCFVVNTAGEATQESAELDGFFAQAGELHRARSRT